MTTDRWKVFVGYDSREGIAWQVCRHSIERLSSPRVAVYPLRQPVLRELGLYTRPADPMASTEFSITRFLTPYISAHEGWTLFVDCDFVFTKPLDQLFEGLSDHKAIYVVQHEYTPANDIKMDGKRQTVYPRKNWSSFIVFNGKHPAVKALTPSVVNSASPAYLHRFEWVDNGDIGELPLTWNYLVGEYAVPAEMPSAIHFTNGGPWFDAWQDVPYGDVWCAERDSFYSQNNSGQDLAII